MDALHNMQLDLFKQINNTFSNFKKKGTPKMTKIAAQARLTGLDDCYTQYKAYHARILSTKDVPQDHPYFSTNLSEQIQDSYFDRKSEFLQFIDEMKQREIEQNPTVLPPTTASDHNVTVTAASIESQSLPKINIPKFSGKFDEWDNFRNLFRSVVHRREEIDSSIKYYYLRTSLTGEALDTIKTIPLSAEHYGDAWNALIKYYDNKRKMVNTLVAQIFDIKSMQQENAPELKRVEREFFSPLESLRKLGRDNAQIGNDLLVYTLIGLFDNSTWKEWKKTIDKSNDTPPTIEQVKEFIKGQIENLDDEKGVSVASSKTNSNNQPKTRGKTKQSKGETDVSTVHSLQTSGESQSKIPCCIFCNGEHSLAKCEQFEKQAVNDRREFAKNKKICFNCLSSGHSKQRCKSRFNCFICRARHHTRLHLENPPSFVSNSTNSPTQSSAPNAPQSVHNLNVIGVNMHSNSTNTTHVVKDTGVLLATALIRIIGSKGKQLVVKALIDPCSQVTLVSQNVCNQLGLPLHDTRIHVQGVGGGDSQLVNKMVQLKLTPHFNSEFILIATALVLPKLSTYKPPMVQSIRSFSYLDNLQLADPNFLEPIPVELLLGADVYAEIVKEAIVRGSANQPIATSSKFGWLLTGRCSQVKPDLQAHAFAISVLHCSSAEDNDSRLIALLQEFWRVEEVGSNKNSCTIEEKTCEDLFTSTTYRDKDGRYFVKLPWKNERYANETHLGNSYTYALRALKRLEANFARDSKLETEYKNFMTEYYDLGHMEPMEDVELSEKLNHFFLPHHGVWKESSSTTKLRTVFNGSSKFNSNETLNDLLYSGPNLLKNPVSLICSGRHYKFALSADLEKMFRMIGINPNDRRFQTILWRWKTSEKIQNFLLNTVTYGLTCALYLAIRVLLQIAQDYAQEHPLAAEIIRDEMYSDNVLSGAHTVEEAQAKIDDLITLFKKTRMNLRKWASNEPKLLDALTADLLAEDKVTMFDAKSSFPILGIAWHVAGDFYCFHLENVTVDTPITKRSVLSRIARIFDLLGWIAPVTIVAKILLQTLWRLKLSWDDSLPEDVAREWSRWVEDLPSVSTIRIPRWTGYTLQAKVELHGFADASKFAYGAVIYLRFLFDAKVSTSLQLAKSKVAPVKTLSIPRLELCAALLLTRLTRQYLEAVKFEISDIHLWTDSADVLFWLRDQPSRWNVFIANRCSEIHTSLPQAFWHHVKSKENPADVISRGIQPSSLQQNELWWKGPPFLVKEPTQWPKRQDELNFGITNVIVASSFEITHTRAEDNLELHWIPLQKYSSLIKVLRVTGYCLRFIARLSRKMILNTKSDHKVLQLPFIRESELPSSFLIDANGLKNAQYFCYYITQNRYLSVEYKLLSQNKRLNVKHPLASLNPMIQNHLIRVGGRLANALIAEGNKHPVILPRSCALTTLMIRHAHLKTLHGGTRLTLAILRQQVWIQSGRTEVKRLLKKCVQCIRYAAKTPLQVMGNLPNSRVQPAKPFEKTGVDYAGPFRVRLTKTRGKGTMKAYVCVFVCMATKAVHLELAEDYSSDAFIAAFHRFTARRGHCSDLFSDKGTNFVGANTQLREMLISSQPPIFNHLANVGTNWHFNPPNAPHFGGLWEAAVKSLKYHLRRVVGEQVLTFSEFSTLLCRIEACLNSRPLIDTSDDPSDLSILTPAHLLIQRASYLLPEADYASINVPVGKRWQLITQATQHFWARWRDEYLSALQRRNKWLQPHSPPKLGDLVLVRNELTPPGQWPLAKIINVHPGKDGQIRVVTVKTQSGIYRRPIVKLILLPTCEL